MIPVRVLLVAQSPVLRYGIRGTLESVLSLETVVEASGALEAAALLRSARPALIVIHDALPGVTANATAKMLQDLLPGATIAILSDQADEGHRSEAEQHGAAALISMAIAPADFAAAIRNVVAGLSFVATDRVMATARVAGLAALEIASLDGLVRRLSTREITERLQAEEHDVAHSVASLIEKLGGDRTTAVVTAVRLGIANLSDQLPSPPLASEVGLASLA